MDGFLGVSFNWVQNFLRKLIALFLAPPTAFLTIRSFTLSQDTSTGNKVWRKTYAETMQGFDFDPFDPSRIAFRCIECVVFIDDFSAHKPPGSASGKKFYVLGPSGGGRGSPIKDEDRGRAAKTRIKRFMKDFVMHEKAVLGGGGGSGGNGDTLALSDCLQVAYHRAIRNHILLVYPREVLILDLDIGQTVGLIALDRGSPQILQVTIAVFRKLPVCNRGFFFFRFILVANEMLCSFLARPGLFR